MIYIFLGKGGHRWTRLVLVGGIADLRRPVTDDEHDLVPPLRELAELAQRHRVAEVKVGVRGVEALFDTQLSVPGAQAGGEVLADDHLGHPTGQELVELGVAGARGHCGEDIGQAEALAWRHRAHQDDTRPRPRARTVSPVAAPRWGRLSRQARGRAPGRARTGHRPPRARRVRRGDRVRLFRVRPAVPGRPCP